MDDSECMDSGVNGEEVIWWWILTKVIRKKKGIQVDIQVGAPPIKGMHFREAGGVGRIAPPDPLLVNRADT